MNKITSTLAGLALVAGVSVVPAFAQDLGTAGNLFSPPGSFTFSLATATATATATTFSATGTNDTFNVLNAAATSKAVTAAFTLTGTQIAATNVFVLNTLIIGSTATNASIFTYKPANNPLTFTFTNLNVPGIPVAIASLGADKAGLTFNLVNPAPVPEASTVVSFGALLALGGLAVVLRRKGVKNAA